MIAMTGGYYRFEPVTNSDSNGYRTFADWEAYTHFFKKQSDGTYQLSSWTGGDATERNTGGSHTENNPMTPVIAINNNWFAYFKELKLYMKKRAINNSGWGHWYRDVPSSGDGYIDNYADSWVTDLGGSNYSIPCLLNLIMRMVIAIQIS